MIEHKVQVSYDSGLFDLAGRLLELDFAELLEIVEEVVDVELTFSSNFIHLLINIDKDYT